MNAEAINKNIKVHIKNRRSCDQPDGSCTLVADCDIYHRENTERDRENAERKREIAERMQKGQRECILIVLIESIKKKPLTKITD